MNIYEESPLICGRQGPALTAVILLHAVFAFALYSELAGPIGKAINPPPIVLARMPEIVRPTIKPPSFAPVIDRMRLYVAPPEVPPVVPEPADPVIAATPAPDSVIAPIPLPHVIGLDARVDPKHPLRIGEAYYPDASRRANETGRCVVQATVAVDGRIIAQALQSSTGYDRLDQACINAVRGQRMLPAIKGGQPIESTVSIPIRWNLSEK